MNMDEITGFINDPDETLRRSESYIHLLREERKQLVLAMSDLRDERAGKFLAGIFPGEMDKEIQKLIKKGLFRLKTMGIKVEDVRDSGEPVLKIIDEKRQHKGFMSNYDIEGTRIVIAAFEAKKNYYLFVNAIMHLSRGLTDMKLAPLPKRDLEAILAEYRKGTSNNNVFVEIPPQYAAYLIEESDAVSHRYADDVSQLKQFASTLKDNVQKPDDIYGLHVPDDILPLPVSTVLSDDLFQHFSLTWDTMEEDRKTLSTITGPTILLPPHMIEEKMETFLKNLLDSEPLRSKISLMKRLLEDYSYLFFLSGRFDCFETLRELLTNEKGLHGALSFFVGKTLETKEQQPDPEPGLIVSPYEQVRR